VFNILEDFSEEKGGLEGMQRAVINIWRTSREKQRLEEMQRATINILEDFSSERHGSRTQRAMLNLLDDFGMERKDRGRSRSFRASIPCRAEAADAVTASSKHSLFRSMTSGRAQALPDSTTYSTDYFGKRRNGQGFVEPDIAATEKWAGS
jgi:hypothetical protein